MENFENLLKKYAHLLIKRGLNVQKGQILLINAEVEQVAFTAFNRKSCCVRQ